MQILSCNGTRKISNTKIANSKYARYFAFIGIKIYDAFENPENFKNSLKSKAKFLMSLFPKIIEFCCSLISDINDSDFATLTFLIMAILCFILFFKRIRQYMNM